MLPGFFPDPSVTKAGDDYYLINSTFQYYPAIVISHSRDLVEWTQIGHVFAKPGDLDLSGFHDGCGIWAPDISYHEGEFYIFYCLVQLTKDRSLNVRGNYLVKSRSIHGPWSAPIQLTTEGNDPSHFVDEDGAHYMTYAAGIPVGKGVKIVRLSDDCSRVVGPAHWLEFEPEKRAPEGPHLLRKDGYYYLTLAAGGGVYSGHHQVVARSRNLLGPYEPSPLPPFIVEHSPDAAYYHHGHAKLLQGPDKAWWCVYLLRRRIQGFSPLGRETALDAVHWTADGWPVLNGSKGPSDRAATTAAHPVRDDFSTPDLDMGWCAIRRWPEGRFSLRARPGFLRLLGGEAGLESRNDVCALLRRETCHHFSASVRLEFNPGTDEEAGLICYYDTENHVKLVVTGGPEPRLILAARARAESSVIADVSARRHPKFWLRVVVDGLKRSFFQSGDGIRWEQAGVLPACGFMSDEGTSRWGFTGTMIGLYARRTPSGPDLEADFTDFRVESV